MVASSVVSTILILNYHHRNADTHEMADWVRDFVVVVYDDDDFFFCVVTHSRTLLSFKLYKKKVLVTRKSLLPKSHMNDGTKSFFQIKYF